MSDDRALKSWVSDQLHGLLGFAEGNLASYVVGLGTSRRERPFPRRRRIDLHSFPAACLSRERQPLTSVRSHPGPVSSPRPLAPQARRRRTPRRSPRSSCRRVCPTRPRRERSPRASSIACPARAAVAGARRARTSGTSARRRRSRRRTARTPCSRMTTRTRARGRARREGAAARRRRGGVGSRRSTANAYVSGGRMTMTRAIRRINRAVQGAQTCFVRRKATGTRPRRSRRRVWRARRKRRARRIWRNATRSPTGFGAATNSTRSDSRRVRTRRRTRMP